jgi:hypothetical protein
MISAKFVKLVEENASKLTDDLVRDIQTNPKSDKYHQFSSKELYQRGFEVYKNLSEWMLEKSESEVRETYLDLGRRRYDEKIPISQVVFGLTLTKTHLIDYIKLYGLADTAVDFYQEVELFSLLSQFYDKAIYYTVCGYEARAEPKQK